MSKTHFITSAMIASISEGVNIRESTQAAINSLVNEKILAQTEASLFAEVQDGEGHNVNYYGPEEYAPNELSTANLTPFETSETTTEFTYAQTNAEYDARKAEHGTGKGSRAQTSAERPFYELYAQTQQEQTHRCTTTMRRNWNTTNDYTAISQGTEMFNDSINFPHGPGAIAWEDAQEGGALSTLDISWMRVSDPNFPTYNGQPKTFWGPNGVDHIDVQDINQGYIGNCWVMAAISALAEHQDRVDKIMISTGLESQGIYAMNFYSLGVPFTQIIDDWIPMNGSSTIFASQGKDGSVWALIVEKMFAKWYGNYEHLVGGWMNLAVAALNGSPWQEKFHQGNASEIWSFITEADQDRDIITAASNFCGSDSETTYQGVACSHAYTVISSHVISYGGQDVQLLLVRNPWGAEQYSGPWSDSWLVDPANDGAIAALPHYYGNTNEGLFWIDLPSYMENFSRTQINQDTHDWELGYFLRHDDPATTETQTTNSNCPGCTEHQIRVKNTSGQTQDVYVGAHVWQDRAYSWRNAQPGGACQSMYAYPQHSIFETEGGNYGSGTFNSGWGSRWLPKFSLGPDEEKTFTTLWNFTADPYEHMRDWSVTAWGTLGDVEVMHVDPNQTTDHNPTWNDGNRSEPQEIVYPPPPPQTCWDSNFGAHDKDGPDYTCATYNQQWCSQYNGGAYDTAEFVSELMCCVCGGDAGCDCNPEESDCDCTNPLDPDGDGEQDGDDQDGDDQDGDDQDGDDQDGDDQDGDDQDGDDQDGDDQDGDGTDEPADDWFFNKCGAVSTTGTEALLSATQVEACYMMICDEIICANLASTETCSCNDDPVEQLVGLYDWKPEAQPDGMICQEEWYYLYYDAIVQMIMWEEEQDDQDEGDQDQDDGDQDQDEGDQDGDGEQEMCYNNDNGGTLYDADGEFFNCAWYAEGTNADYCGGYDHAQFDSAAMCCVCGGGCDCDPADATCDCPLPWEDEEDQDGDKDDQDGDQDGDDQDGDDQDGDDQDGDQDGDQDESQDWFFNKCGASDNSVALLSATQVEACYMMICDEIICANLSATETCSCNDDPVEQLVGIYDYKPEGAPDGMICQGEFYYLFYDAISEMIPWEEEQDDQDEGDQDQDGGDQDQDEGDQDQDEGDQDQDEGDQDQDGDDGTQTPFEQADEDGDGFLNTDEVMNYYWDWCMDECVNNNDCSCYENDDTQLLPLYDEQPDGMIDNDEFQTMSYDLQNGLVPWVNDNDEGADGDETDGDEGTDGDEADNDDGTDGDEQADGDEEADNGDEETDGEGFNQDDFDFWVEDQQIPQGDYYCQFDIRNHWHNGYFLWAGHNCEIYDLTLKVYFPKEAWQTRQTWISDDITCLGGEAGNCAECPEDSDECCATFFMTPNNNKLGIGFDPSGEPINFRYETVSWTDCVDNMEMD